MSLHFYVMQPCQLSRAALHVILIGECIKNQNMMEIIVNWFDIFVGPKGGVGGHGI